MAVLETLTFRLVEGVDDADFVETDKRLQTEFVYLQPGLVRRTTARGDDGEWIVVTLWRSGPEFDAAAALARGSSVVSEFVAMLDESTIRTGRYTMFD